MYVKSFFLCLSFVATLSSSIGSNSESLLVCSKFHFEEKLLEKLVRLEHKMELTEEKMKKWEDSFSSKLDKMDSAIRQTKEFVESIRIYHAQEQVRINDSYQEIVKRVHIQLKNVTNFNGEQMKTSLDSMSSQMQESSEAEKNRQKALELMRYTLNQEQQRFNNSFDLILENFRLASNDTFNELIATQQKVAMTACVKQGNTVTGVVKFNDIKTNSNISNLSYFKSNGKFITETEGLYLVSTWIFSYTNGASYAVYKNGKSIALAYAHYDTDTSNTNGGSASAIVSTELKAGDVVWAQTTTSMFVYAQFSCLTIVKLK
ncbi:uncharacterized protein [Mytilus edulis]|uniref:uncharacterized protein isoform X2 n=1 Tax=Mytilus edulis TaxID=6550 RepID=UPI0039EF02CE